MANSWFHFFALIISQEPHTNGPLFTELAFYQRVAKPELSMSQNCNIAAYFCCESYLVRIKVSNIKN